MEILEAFDLTGSLRGAAALAGCDHKTVAHYVALREAGQVVGEKPPRAMLIDEFVGKIEELNRPGTDGGSQSMEDESRGSTEEVRRGAA